MVKCTNGTNVIEVPTAAYENLFKDMGFRLIDEDKRTYTERYLDEKPEVEDNADDAFVNEISEKPISEWTKAEIKKFASIKGIDLTGKNVNEAREAVKEFLSEQ